MKFSQPLRLPALPDSVSRAFVPALERNGWISGIATVSFGVLVILFFRRSQSQEQIRISEEAESSDPGLLRKHSTCKSYSTSITTYPRIRTFYHPHPHASKLPERPPFPLLVFVHGLGGSLAQFGSLLTTLVNSAPCFGIDLPGCGLSGFSPRDWRAYSHRALVELLATAIQEACDASGTQQVVLVGHSLGCSLSVSVATPSAWAYSPHTFDVVGLVAICPKVAWRDVEGAPAVRRLLQIPTWLFDLWRVWERAGGVHSASVRRLVHEKADMETKKMQLRFNEQSRSDVWRRMAWGSWVETGGAPGAGLPGADEWAALRVPVLLVAGEADRLTPPEEIPLISKALSAHGYVRYHEVPALPGTSPSYGTTTAKANSLAAATTLTDTAADAERQLGASEDASATQTAAASRLILKTYVLPSPASHSLLYDRGTYRTLSGLVQTFIADEIDPRLSLGWQLQHLKDANKWDVKNLAKWQAVAPVSAPIAGNFRAMKTLREADPVHSPQLFVQHWRDHVKAVIDISHESPVYNPRELDDGGIEYHKFPTVSKLPPTPSEVDEFVALVDRLRDQGSPHDHRLIGVHCHYGYNRTGFFICAYLIEKLGFTVQGALNEFQARRGPGIRHEHFIDTLFVRYCVGLKRPSVAKE